jgi:hypothetical protein
LKKKGKFLHPPSNLTNSIAGQTCIPENNTKENFKKLKGIFLISTSYMPYVLILLKRRNRMSELASTHSLKADEISLADVVVYLINNLK